MFHIFRYELLTMLRNKNSVFWTLAFPLILGTLFYVSFGNVFSSDEDFSTVPVAIVKQAENTAFFEAIDNVDHEDNALFKVTETDGENALKMLENGDVSGVIYVGEKITLSVKKEGINQTIIKSFLDCYKANESIVTETAEKNPEKVSDVVAAMTAEINCNAEKNLSGKNTDTAVQYFYNLMAMACLFASLSGITLAIKNQGNLSDVGARKCVSCADKLKSAAAGLAAAVLVNFVCNAIGLAYLLYVLRINFGAAALPLFGITFVGSLTGVAIGFLVGSVGTASENVKTVVLVSVIMLCCFFSGLMAYNMRMVVDKYAPWFNRINPAALISDSFYSLNIYSTYERLLRNLITLAVIAAVCLIGGFLAVRRKKYASL